MVDQLGYFLEWTKRTAHMHDFYLLRITHSVHEYRIFSHLIKESVRYSLSPSVVCVIVIFII